MDMITKAEIEGFKSIRKAEIELRPLNVMIGANGSGKSNFLRYLEYAVRAGRLDDILETGLHGGAQSQLYYGGFYSNHCSLIMRLRQGAADAVYRSTLARSPRDFIYSMIERYPSEAALELDEKMEEFHRFFERQCFFHFHDVSLRARINARHLINDNHELKRDAYNLAAFVDRLCRSHPEYYQRIVETIRTCLPYFGDFVFGPMADNARETVLMWRERGWDFPLDGTQISDGSLRFMALTTLLLQPPELMPKLIVIDEPELGLHPHALILLAGMLHRASRHVQVIVATQSPALISHFEPEDIIVCERQREPGADRFESSFYRLDTARLKDWLEEYSLGEMLERNLFYPPPEPEALGR